LNWLKGQLRSGYIRHRKTGISDYTIVGSAEANRVMRLLQPYVKLKSQHVALGLQILEKMKNLKSKEDFMEVCKLVDKFGEINYSKKRKLTYSVVEKALASKSLPL